MTTALKLGHRKAKNVSKQHILNILKFNIVNSLNIYLTTLLTSPIEFSLYFQNYVRRGGLVVERRTPGPEVQDSNPKAAIVSYLINNQFETENDHYLFELRHEKPVFWGFRSGPTQTGLYNHRIWLQT